MVFADHTIVAVSERNQGCAGRQHTPVVARYRGGIRSAAEILS